MKCFSKFSCLFIFTSNYLVSIATINNNNTNINININGLPDIARELKKLTDQKYNATSNWLKSNRYVFAGAGLAGAYAYIGNNVTHGKIVLYSSTNWANWKNDTTLTDLLSKSTSNLCRELHQSILDKYSNNNQADMMAPIVSFSKDLEQELTSLKVFCQIGKNLKRVRMKLLFLISDYELELASDKINRLLYLKNIITESIQVSLNS